MGSHAATRDFQWTSYEKPRAPPPLPSLPPWAAHAQPPAASTTGSQAVGMPQQPSADAGGAWRRPTSYFGAMKRLPMQAQAPQEPADDADDEERRRYYQASNVHPPASTTPAVAPPPRHSAQQINENESGGRHDWLYDSAADPWTNPTKVATNQREDDAADDIEDVRSQPAQRPVVSQTKIEQQPEADSNAGGAEESPVVKALATEEAFFRPWKRGMGSDNNNNGNDDGGGDDGEPSTANKWKVRALFNPFAKRKPSHKPTAPPSPATYELEQQQQQQDDGENPAAPSPTLAPRSMVQRTPPPPRRQSNGSVVTKRTESAPIESPHAPVPIRPRTPTIAPAPVVMQHPHDAVPVSATPPQRRPSRGHIRSREAVVLPHLPPPNCEPPRFEDNAELPTALANISDLRKSTAQLAPLEPPEYQQRAVVGRHELSVQRHANPVEDDDDDNEADSRSVVRVLKSVPPKPPTQLQQLKQLHKESKQKPKKGATIDALKEIQRKREERRNAQAEEKQRMKTEMEQHGDDAGYKFRRLIQRYRDAMPAAQRAKPAKAASGALVSAPSNQRLCVFVRKRPLAKKELKAKGYDILTCLYAAAAQDKTKALEPSLRRELMCHEPKLKVDCSESLENHAFHFDGVFDNDQDNETVYTATVGPLVPFLVQGLSPSAANTSATSLTVFAYGQTGSGKTYTMKSIYRQAASDLFARLAASRGHVVVGVSFYEIYMNQVNDLLNLRKRVQLMEDGEGVVQLLGLKEVGIASADELMELIAIGEEARATSANAVHDDSSRSHALLRVTISGADSGAVLARLSMVDLAGSERACDTQSDSKSTRMEGAEINKSLLALKECIRALDRGATHIPFRQSKLTQLLRDSFLSANSKTVMIATVSPCSDSCNHTLNTLRYADRLKEIGAS